MNFKLSDIVEFKRPRLDTQNHDYKLLDRLVGDCEFEKSLLEKYSNWKTRKLALSTVFTNNKESILLADSMENDDGERIDILVAICEGISRDQAKSILEISNYNLEEAESYYKSQPNQSSAVKITFVTTYWPEFSQTYSPSSSLWEIGKDLYMNTGNQSEFKILIEETQQVLDFEVLFTNTFSQLNLKGSYRFKVNFLSYY